jgi:hypothetical protein
MNPRPTKLILIVSGMVTAFAAAGAQAALITSVVGPYTWSTDRANFSMLDPGGYVIGGTNDVSMVWDGLLVPTSWACTCSSTGTAAPTTTYSWYSP